MPPFGSMLNDTEIADIVNHERTSCGNQAKQVTADDVKARRAAGGGAKPSRQSGRVATSHPPGAVRRPPSFGRG
jgi:hypothetical protein